MSNKECTSKECKLRDVLEEVVEEINSLCHFSQRDRQINAKQFVQLLVLGWLKQPTASLNELAGQAQEMRCDISAGGLHERIGPEAVMLLAAVLSCALRRLQAYQPLPIEILKQFEGIYVTDSTQIALPQTLSELFVGNKSNAIVKLHVTIDYLHGNWAALELVDGKSPDQSCKLHVAQALAGSLQLFDLGYFKQEYLRDIDAQDAWFVSRYQSQTALYNPNTGERLDLVAWLKQLPTDCAECQVELGQRVHLNVRLLARRVNQKIAQARRRKAKKKAKRQGKTYSAAYLFLLGWDLLISNLPPEAWPLAQLFDLYPIRTQIEWVFRIWKSQLGLDRIGNWRIERVLCQLYAHLIAALLCHMLSADWRLRDGTEYSLLKCVQVIQRHVDDLMCCIAHSWRGLRQWLTDLEGGFRRFATKNKRKNAPSTCQILINWGLT